MKLLICGSRGWTNRQLISSFIYLLQPTLVITGGAKGADMIGEEEARKDGIEVKVFLPDWITYGKRAGFLRNSQMLAEKPDLVLAFWDGISRGTQDTITKARAAGIPLHIVRDDKETNDEVSISHISNWLDENG